MKRETYKPAPYAAVPMLPGQAEHSAAWLRRRAVARAVTLCSVAVIGAMGAYLLLLAVIAIFSAVTDR